MNYSMLTLKFRWLSGNFRGIYPDSRQGLENDFDGFPDEDDFILEYEMAIGKVLGFLGLDTAGVEVPGSHFAQLADDKVEEWSQRFQLPITI